MANEFWGNDFGGHLKRIVYTLDATTIDLCLSLFLWAPFHKHFREMTPLSKIMFSVTNCNYLTNVGITLMPTKVCELDDLLLVLVCHYKVIPACYC